MKEEVTDITSATDGHKSKSVSSAPHLVAMETSDTLTETEERKSERHEQFEMMAVKIGFPTSYDFAVHVKDTTKMERMELLKAFYGAGSASSTRDKSKAKNSAEKLEVKNASSKKGTRRGVSRKQLHSSDQSRKPIKRKHQKALEFVEETPPSPKKSRDHFNSQDSDSQLGSSEPPASKSTSLRESIPGESEFPEIEGDSKINVNKSSSDTALNDLRTSTWLRTACQGALKFNLGTQESKAGTTLCSDIEKSRQVQSSLHARSPVNGSSDKSSTLEGRCLHNNSKFNANRFLGLDRFKNPEQNDIVRSQPKFAPSFNIDELFDL